MAIIERNGYLVDDQTGEVMGVAELDAIAPDEEGGAVVTQAPFEINGKAAAEWVLKLMQQAEVEILTIETRKQAQLDATMANFEKQIAPLRAELSFLNLRFGTELEGWAKRDLEGQKRRSIATDWGVVGLRKNPSSIKVSDPEGALAWVTEHVPTAVKIVPETRTVSITNLKGMEDMLPETCFDVTLPYDKFYILTGVPAKKGS